MGFFQILKQLDELLYGIMSWLIFYPITLWRAIRHPWQMMDYADSELGDKEEQQYNDTLSPPLFLVVSLLIAHAVEIALLGENPMIASKAGLDALIDDDTNLLMLRIAIFSLFPLIMATRLVRRRKIGLNRDTLRPPFFSQCYVAAPFALILSLSSCAERMEWPHADPIAIGLMVLAFIWYGTLQVRWFAEHLNTSVERGFIDASIAMIECVIGLLVMLFLFG